MKKLKCYYLYLVFVIILTTALAVLEAVAISLEWFEWDELLWLSLSLTVLDTCLWLIAVIKKPSLTEVSRVLRTEVAKKYIDKKTVEKELEKTLRTIQQCKEAADEANKNHVICKDLLAKEPD